MIAEAQKTSAYDKLTTRQRLFVDKYVSSRNATQAAKEAGYSPQTARQMGSENLSKPSIKEAIEEKLHCAEPDYRLTPERLRQHTIDLLNDKTLKPDQRIKVIDLAGRMTPGTFAGDNVPQGPRVTFNTLKLELNAPLAPIAPMPIVEHVPAPSQTPAPVGGEAVTPPPPSMYRDTTTPENVGQKQVNTSLDVSSPSSPEQGGGI